MNANLQNWQTLRQILQEEEVRLCLEPRAPVRAGSYAREMWSQYEEYKRNCGQRGIVPKTFQDFLAKEAA